MSKQHYFGVDLGGESGRVMLAAFDGKRLHIDEKHRFTIGAFASQTLALGSLADIREVVR